MPGSKSARQVTTSEDRLVKIRLRSINISQAEINGIRRMWEASSFPNEYRRRAAKAVQESKMLQANHITNSSQRRFGWPAKLKARLRLRKKASRYFGAPYN